MATVRQPGLLGRTTERELLDRLLAAVRGGESAVLVLRGDAGVGKTALLRHAARHVTGRVAQIAGIEAEAELPFAALHQLCAPLLDRLDALPAPQRDALRVAFGLSAGGPPDRFLVGLAVLGLLSAVAEERPLLCLVDDAGWLDGASALTLAFVARRLRGQPVGMVLAAREPREELRGLPEHVVEGLGSADARTLLARAAPWPIDARVRDQALAETRGNPLALLGLLEGLTPAALAGGFALPGVLAPSGELEERVLRALGPLPPDTRRLLVVAAAEPLGDPALLRSAAQRLATTEDALAPAVSAGLLDVGARVRFCHPHARAVVLHAAPPAERRAAHAVLAEATDPAADPERRAWHRGQAAPGPDEGVAAELEEAAPRAGAHGGLAAVAAFLERGAALTPEGTDQARRLLAAARAQHLAGAPDLALGLLAGAAATAPDERTEAGIELLRAQIAATGREGDAPGRLVRAASRLEPLDPALARDAWLEAVAAAERAGGPAEVVRAAAAAPGGPSPARAGDLLLDGLTAHAAAGPSAGVPLLQRALDALRAQDAEDEEVLRWSSLAGRAALAVWDDEAWDVLTARHLEVARRTGATSALPLALGERIAHDVLAGELGAAAAHLEELRAVTAALGAALAPDAPVLLACWSGGDAEAPRRIALARGDGGALRAVGWASAVLHECLGRHDEALAAAQRLATGPGAARLPDPGAAELVLAAARCGRRREAAVALEELTQRARSSGSDWALGIRARCAALLSAGDAAEELHREAVERLARTRVRAELARAHLHFGEWLRREGRRVDAREQLRSAHTLSAELGMRAFAERAERELAATGEHARRRVAETREELTEQERQIAQLARDGLSNPQIGARLFLSPRTVEWHLRKVFTKLGIRSRRELPAALPSAGRELVPA